MNNNKIMIMSNTKIIAFANHKGGVGKTTTTVNVGSILAERGKRVLVIDMDGQANLTASLLSQETEDSIYYALTRKRDTLPVISVKENLDIVPSSLALCMAELEIAPAINREMILSKLIDPLKQSYDFILIDCPPTLTLLTLNALAASNEIVIPLVAEVLPFKGLKMIGDFIDLVRNELNPSAHLTGVLLTRWERSRLSQQIDEGLRARLGDLVFKTKIRKNVRAAEAPLQSQSIIEYAPDSAASQDYQAFTEELLSRCMPDGKKAETT